MPSACVAPLLLTVSIVGVLAKCLEASTDVTETMWLGLVRWVFLYIKKLKHM